MNIYLISQDKVQGEYTFDSAVVVASSEIEAINTHPEEYVTHSRNGEWMVTLAYGGMYIHNNDDWVKYKDIDLINVELIGKTDKPKGVILASFNAG